MILVTGGTGTLGRELVGRLVAAGERVRVMTRDRSRTNALPAVVDIVIGHLGDDACVKEAVRGCKAVISAAHGFVGPGKPTPETVDRDGNCRLVRAALDEKVGRFVLISVMGAGARHPMSLARAKFAAEEELHKSGLSSTIVRASPFMETWLNMVGETLDDKGYAMVFGPGTNPINFVSVRDVAALVVMAVRGEAMDRLYEIGGPENIGLATVAERLIEARGRPAQVKHIPLAALRVLSFLARPIWPGFARQAQAAVLMNTADMSFDPAGRSRLSRVPITTFAEVLAVARRNVTPAKEAGQG